MNLCNYYNLYLAKIIFLVITNVSSKRRYSYGVTSIMVLVDIHLNNFENKLLMLSCNKQQDTIKMYLRYVDDTFIILNGSNRQVENLSGYMNIINTKLPFTLQMENNNSWTFSISLLEKIKISSGSKFPDNLITTNITIHAESYHPYSKEMAAFNAVVHRMLAIYLEQKDSGRN